MEKALSYGGMTRHRLQRDRAALLVVDVQEKLAKAMPPDAFARVLNRTLAAIHGAKALGLPVVVTEQYPKGLGATVPEVREALGGDARPFEKLDFSCALGPVLERLAGRDQVLVAGMETHVCVFQTLRDLSERRLQPYLLSDASLSRTEEDRRVGVELSREAGSVVTTVETALFDLLQRAGTPEFKAVSAAVK